MLQYLTCPLVSAHLQANGCVVHGRLDMSFGVIQVPSGAICIHTCLTGTLVGPHLKQKRWNKSLIHTLNMQNITAFHSYMWQIWLKGSVIFLPWLHYSNDDADRRFYCKFSLLFRQPSHLHDIFPGVRNNNKYRSLEGSRNNEQLSQARMLHLTWDHDSVSSYATVSLQAAMSNC